MSQLAEKCCFVLRRHRIVLYDDDFDWLVLSISLDDRGKNTNAWSKCSAVLIHARYMMMETAVRASASPPRQCWEHSTVIIRCIFSQYQCNGAAHTCSSVPVDLDIRGIQYFLNICCFVFLFFILHFVTIHEDFLVCNYYSYYFLLLFLLILTV